MRGHKNTVQQMRWILTKAVELLNKYDQPRITDRDYEDMIADVGDIVELSKGNEYCRSIMLEVVEAFDNEYKKQIYA